MADSPHPFPCPHDRFSHIPDPGDRFSSLPPLGVFFSLSLFPGFTKVGFPSFLCLSHGWFPPFLLPPWLVPFPLSPSLASPFPALLHLPWPITSFSSLRMTCVPILYLVMSGSPIFRFIPSLLLPTHDHFPHFPFLWPVPLSHAPYSHDSILQPSPSASFPIVCPSQR